MGAMGNKLYENVELYYEPQQILKMLSEKTDDKVITEMTSFELAFLCGMIKAEKPKKIVEIGIAAGGTTSVILQCLDLLNIDTALYSVDIAERFYKNPRKATGYLADAARKIIPLNKISYKKFLCGIAECIGEIAPERDIDFLVLDTTHSMPGEILDFITCLPYCKSGGVTVLHDLSYHHQSNTGKAGFATQVLFSAVSGQKYFMFDEDSIQGLSNIGAFRIDEKTKAEIRDVFSSLSVSWDYRLDEELLEGYRKIISANYSKEIIAYFDKIVNIQRSTFAKELIRLKHKKTYSF